MDIKENIDEWIKNPENERHMTHICDNMDCNIVTAMDKPRPHWAAKDKFIVDRYQVIVNDDGYIYRLQIIGNCGNCENNKINLD